MFKEERQQKILDMLEVEKRVYAKELSKIFNVSEDTIRRDLKELDAKGLIKRVYSGALRMGPPVTDFNHRTTVKVDEKNKLAKKAVTYLEEDSIILIDGSTTNLALANAFPSDFTATIITNSPPVSVALSNYRNIEIINIGGQYYKQSMINFGVNAFKNLKDMRADFYIMGIYNIDMEEGTSVPTNQEAEMKRLMTEISTEVLSMVTPDKFGTISNHIVGNVEDITYLFTTELSESSSRNYDKQNLIFV